MRLWSHSWGAEMKRWIVTFLGLIATVGMAAGCQQKCFISEKDFYTSHQLPPSLENGDSTSLVQASHETIPAPPNIDNPDRPPRNLSLQEAIAIALENGTTGSRNGGVNTPGTVDDSPSIVTGGSLNAQSDRVRVLAMDPAISQAAIEAALSRYDALSVTSFTTTTTDELLQGLSSFNNGSQATLNTSVIKALSSGGVVSTSFQTQYTLLSAPPAGAFGVINPNYTTRLTFGFEQPLLRNFGTDINELLNRIAPITGVTMPAQASTAYNNQQSNLTAVAGQPIEGILIARLRFDQHRAEFERQMHNLLLNVEVAYWNLYEAYGTLYANEEVLRVLHKTWMDNFYKAEGGTVDLSILAQIRGQYEEFRGERTNSLGNVLEAERNLRGILGLAAEDGTRLVPVTPPTLSSYQPNWDAALSDAMIHRPELVLARQNLRFHEMALTREKNSLKPDLRLVAQYQPVGFGTTLTGNGTFIDGAGNTQVANSYRSLSSDRFNDWTVGINLAVPLGYRFEHASVRTARLQLAQAYYVLKDQEDRVKRTLTQQYQGLNKWYRLIEDRRAERKAYAEALKKKFDQVQVGKKGVDLDLLDVQRRLALALTKEYQAIAEYNNSLARLEFARGTIMQHDNVIIAENGLTPRAQVRAVEHEKERTKALVLLERPTPHTRVNPINLPGMVADDPTLPKKIDAITPLPPADETTETPAAFPTDTEVAPKTSADAELPPLAPEAIEPVFKSKAAPSADMMPPVTIPAVDLPGTSPALGQEAPALRKTSQTPALPTAPPLVPPTITPTPKAIPTLPPPPPLPNILGSHAAPNGVVPPAPAAPATPLPTPPAPKAEATDLQLPPAAPIPDVVNDN